MVLRIFPPVLYVYEEKCTEYDGISSLCVSHILTVRSSKMFGWGFSPQYSISHQKSSSQSERSVDTRNTQMSYMLHHEICLHLIVHMQREILLIKEF